MPTHEVTNQVPPRYGHPAVADAYNATRLGHDRGDVFGTLPQGVDAATILDRATPKVG